jgi:hypothetical protein
MFSTRTKAPPGPAFKKEERGGIPVREGLPCPERELMAMLPFFGSIGRSRAEDMAALRPQSATRRPRVASF